MSDLVCPVTRLGPALSPMEAAERVRTRGCCEAYGIAPDECHGWLQVHEVARGSLFRQLCLPYPELRLLLCQRHHQFVTLHPYQVALIADRTGVFLSWGGMSARWLAELGLLREVNTP